MVGDLNRPSLHPLTMLGMKNLVNFPTRLDTQLDHVLINDPSLYTTRRRAPLSNSDHSIVAAYPNIYSKENKQKLIRSEQKIIKMRNTSADQLQTFRDA